MAERKRKKKSIIPRLFTAALAAIVIVLFILFLCGGRYIKNETIDGTDKFLGYTVSSENGRLLKSGKIYYANGVIAKIAGYDKSVTFANGETVDACTELTFSNGQTYIGQMSGLSMSGKGRFIFSSGDVYEGSFAGNKFQGDGVYRWSDGSVYKGQYESGKKSGKCIYALDDCPENILDLLSYDRIIALSGSFTVESVASLPEGTWYVGEIKDNSKQGFGICKYVNGSVYVGEFTDDLRNGKGKYFYANGDVYEGDFASDKASGVGTYSWADGNSYTGEFSDNTLNGQGTYTWSDGKKAEGVFENGKLVDQTGTGNDTDIAD